MQTSSGGMADATREDGAKCRVEVECVIEMEGKKFESGGAIVEPERFTAYIGKKIEPYGVGYGYRWQVKAWGGEELGIAYQTGSWPVNHMWNNTMYSYVVRIGGVYYTARGYGEGMIVRGRRKAKQNWD